MSPSAFSRPIHATVSRQALRHNYQQVGLHAPQARRWAVVKANAYGHGLKFAVDALRDLADGFAVLEPETAVGLRAQGVTQPILLLEGVFRPQDVALLQQNRLTTVIHHPWQLEAIAAQHAAQGGTGLALYLKLNTGMNRLGLVAEQLPLVHQLLATLPAAELTWMTHFADADSGGGVASVACQMQRFRELVGGWEGPVSLGNSAAILRHPGSQGDWVRPGIMLYGGSPFADQSAASLGLQPVMALSSALIGVQELKSGDQVGYGATYCAPHHQRVGVVACGYADGYPRHAPTGTPVAVGGRPSRVLGRVSMDMLAVDLTEIPEATIGTPVTLWGAGEGGFVDADAVAAAAGTISYELFCGLAQRVPVSVI